MSASVEVSSERAMPRSEWSSSPRRAVTSSTRPTSTSARSDLRLADLRAEQPQLGAERGEILQRPVVEIERRAHEPALVGLPEPRAVARARVQEQFPLADRREHDRELFEERQHLRIRLAAEPDDESTGAAVAVPQWIRVDAHARRVGLNRDVGAVERELGGALAPAGRREAPGRTGGSTAVPSRSQTDAPETGASITKRRSCAASDADGSPPRSARRRAA